MKNIIWLSCKYSQNVIVSSRTLKGWLKGVLGVTKRNNEDLVFFWGLEWDNVVRFLKNWASHKNGKCNSLYAKKSQAQIFMGKLIKIYVV